MDKAEPKFKVGQIVIIKSGNRAIPFRILGMMYEYDEWYYQWNRKNFAAEHMIRSLSIEEIGVQAAPDDLNLRIVGGE